MTEENICPREEIAAYIDGELDRDCLERFEDHVSRCEACRAELRQQRQLLCTLDAAFSAEARFDLPLEFTRIVATHAESDLRGLRGKSERSLAVKVCALLALVAFSFLGAASSGLLFQPARNLAQLLARVLRLLWQATADVTQSVGIIVRVLARGMISSPYVWPTLTAITLIIAVSLLSLMIGRYHRTQTIE